ncbi:hypothetical protein FMF07_03970 [Staphylococcus delphini]|nr:hypothetical protein [Staphylococcus delphini]
MTILKPFHMTSKNLAENIAKSSVVIYNLILLKSMFKTHLSRYRCVRM